MAEVIVPVIGNIAGQVVGEAVTRGSRARKVDINKPIMPTVPDLAPLPSTPSPSPIIRMPDVAESPEAPIAAEIPELPIGAGGYDVLGYMNNASRVAMEQQESARSKVAAVKRRSTKDELRTERASNRYRSLLGD